MLLMLLLLLLLLLRVRCCCLVGGQLLSGLAVSLHPRVVEDLVEIGSVLRTKRQQPLDQGAGICGEGGGGNTYL